MHAAVLAGSIAVAVPALAALDTPLADGTYRAERGYYVPKDSCPARVEIEGVRIKGGVIAFENGEAIWSGTIGAENGIVRIDASGITPRPAAALNIRGHYRKAQLYSAVCGNGYFRILR